MLIECQTPVKFKGSDIASIQFPFKLKNVDQVDSKLSPSVQLCDILIGGTISSTNQFARDKTLSVYSSLKLYGDDQLIYFCPNTNFEELKKSMNGNQGNELINFVAEQFHKPVS